MNSPVVAIIQARMASSRLPGKVLLDIGGQPMLVRVVERVKRAHTVERAVVATTTDPSDDPVERLCQDRGYPCYRGSAQDVLDRYYQAACLFGAEIVVRITADCPVIDPGLIDETVKALYQPSAVSHGLTYAQAGGQPSVVSQGLTYAQAGGQTSFVGDTHPSTFYDFAANRLPPPWGRTYPIGLDVEACTFAGLETVWKEARQPHQREHAMPFFYENPQRFRICLLNYETDLSAYRWTVDSAEDLELLRQIYSRFGGRDDFSWLDVLALFEREPELARINAGVRHKDYREIDDR